ncbi:hypothetical protein QFZ35_001916 [Arthrobacter ulcerisalmonis]|uniref:hypothetical protein n=1 Tax=Arthrobacter sp. B1I2 TaxID=3042263 RepID=UPI002788EC09|nr:MULTISPECIES: hypothetical protein [Arthrobacter]MDQ0663418.1 hypothetical protein [Arthrobacter ulcerisalmonis]MDQ0731308.1 hypothetical protein [Arthrobacter sp. B1I2]
MIHKDDRERQNDDVYAEHKAALARGEKRVLRKTDTGALHSYPADEIGFSPGRGQAQVRTWWGMGIVSAFLGLVFLGSSVLFLGSFRHGEHPEWGALFPIMLGGFGAWYTFGMSRDEYRAKKLRKERHAPEPGAGHVSQ